MNYRCREIVYHITLLQTRAADSEASVTVDGVEQLDQAIPLANDRRDARPR